MTLSSEYYENRKEPMTIKEKLITIIVSCAYVSLMVLAVVKLG